MKNTIYIILAFFVACSAEGVKQDTYENPGTKRGSFAVEQPSPDALSMDTIVQPDTLVFKDTKDPTVIVQKTQPDAKVAVDTLLPPDTTPPTDTLVLTDTQPEPKDTLVATDALSVQTPDAKPAVVVNLNIKPATTSPLYAVQQGNSCWPYGKFESIPGKKSNECFQFGYCAFVQPEVTGCKNACIGSRGQILPIPERIERTCQTDGVVGKAGGCEIDEICGKNAENILICKRIHCKTLGVTNIECPQGVWCLPSLSELGGTCSTSVDEAKLVRLGAGICT